MLTAGSAQGTAPLVPPHRPGPREEWIADPGVTEGGAIEPYAVDPVVGRQRCSRHPIEELAVVAQSPLLEEVRRQLLGLGEDLTDTTPTGRVAVVVAQPNAENDGDDECCDSADDQRARGRP